VVSINHTRTGRLVIAGLWLDAGIVMSASAVNGGRAFVALGEPFAAGLALGVAVDVALAVALWGDRALHLAGESSPWGRVLRVTTALMSGALNCSVAVWSGHHGVAAFHAFLPLLLILLTEYAQSSTLKFGHIAGRQRATEEAARAEAELAQRRERQGHTRRERELVASLASVLAIGTRLATRPAPARQVVTPAPRQPKAPAKRQPVRQAPDLAELTRRARSLPNLSQLGRGQLARELGCSTHWAREVLKALDNEQIPLRAVVGS